MSYNDFKRPQLSESSQSDLELQPNQFKITSNPGKNIPAIRQNKYNESSESDISSLSEQSQDDERFPKQSLQNHKRTIELNHSDSDSQEESSKSSIDIIEQRIRKMEVDFQAKIQKQKNAKNNSKISQKKVPSNDFKHQLLSNPPLPHPQRIQVKNSLQIRNKEEEHTPLYSQSQNLNKMNIAQKDLQFYLKETTKNKQEQEQMIIVPKQSQPSKESPKKKIEKKTNLDRGSPKVHKIQTSNKSTKGKQQPNAVTLLNKAHRQIDQMQKVIDELRKENQSLKEELKRSKKKPSTQQLKQLRKLSSGGDLKLQKQIETLKAIESLQTKLKKSINKKMKNNGQNTNFGIVHSQF